MSPPFSSNLLLHPDSFSHRRRRPSWFSGFYCGCISGGRKGWTGRGWDRGGQARQVGEEGGWGDTSLLSDLQFSRHLTEGAGQTKGEGGPVVPDRALEGGRERLGPLPRVPGDQPPVPRSCCSRPRAHLDAITLAHAGAQGVQASWQVGGAAALPEVVGDAAGEAQRGEGAAQTCGERGPVRTGPTRCASCRLCLPEGRG